MGLLDNFEQRLDQLVNGSFAKAFRDAVEPVELASRIQKEMDTRSAVVSKGRTVVPNVFAIELAPSDLERLDIYDEPRPRAIEFELLRFRQRVIQHCRFPGRRCRRGEFAIDD